MGCSESKIDNLPAVSLCRDRCKFLDCALRHLHALAKAHVAYTSSLHSSGTSLRLFFDRHLGASSGPPASNGNVGIKSPTPAATVTATSPSTSSSSRSSGSHIKFDSDSDADENPGGKPTAFHRTNNGYEDYYNPESLNVFFDKFTSINYMKRHPTRPTTYSHPVHDNHYEIDRFFHSDEPPPPPPPPAPSESAWDFMNFFEQYELPFSSSRREVKEVQVLRKEEKKIAGEVQGEGKVGIGSRDDDRNGDYEVKKENVKEREEEKEKEKERYDDNGRKVLREVEALFQKASESGTEVLKLVNDDVFGVRYCQVNGVNRGASFQSHAAAKADEETTPFIENQEQSGMRKKTNKKGSEVMGIDGDGGDAAASVGSKGNLSSTLKKLCMWEKKLLREVKTEEKLRVMYARKCQELKRLTEKGADASKIDSTRTMIGSLSMRLKISLHVIDKISLKINKLSDEELCPLIDELIHCLLEMWRVMLECHRGQFRTVAGAKDLDRVELELEDHAGSLEVLLQLKLEIHSLNLNFSNWVSTMAGCAGALNGWLVRCLGDEPEEVLDAPPVSVICSRWAQAVGRIKEKEVFDSMRELHGKLTRVAESQCLYLQSKQVQDKEVERKVKVFEREEQRLQRAMHEREKRLDVSPGKHAGGGFLHRKNEIDKRVPLQECLKAVFESMERFALDSMEAYEELLACTREVAGDSIGK